MRRETSKKKKFKVKAYSGIGSEYLHVVGDVTVKFEGGIHETDNEAVIANLKERSWCEEVR